MDFDASGGKWAALIRISYAKRTRRGRGTRPWLIMLGLSVAVAVVFGSPLVMVRLSGLSLPWDQLADIGDAYGGVSALLSAAALCGVGTSLIFQRRQVRQELAEIDRQHHIELLKLAIENPELIEVLDARTAVLPHARQQLYANLVMMYWLAIWQLGEVDDSQLRSMAATMFRSRVTRNWWAEYGDSWIGVEGRPHRARFVSMISDELRRAQAGVTVVDAAEEPVRGKAPFFGAACAVLAFAFAWRQLRGR